MHREPRALRRFSFPNDSCDFACEVAAKHVFVRNKKRRGVARAGLQFQ